MDFISSKATTFLIIVNVVMFLLETKDGGSTNTSVALKYGAQYSPYVKQGQYYRLFTAMFLHFGALHLLFNMYALSVLGPAVDRVCGPVIFLIIYLLSGIAGNLATYLVDSKRSRKTVSAGASGCIFGLLGACFVLAVAGYGFSLPSIMTTLAVNLVYGLSSKRINMTSHAGGFAGGAVIMGVILLALKYLQ
ncbi:MAG: rhomboid family intramembrane serine protease [Lachnospiraceae bacterium]|nr:rhomboid family intramembrane serine protease [Lachnospiraceae bacterium]